MCIIGSKHMLLVRFYLLCYGYESTFCWLTKKWSVLDVCIVTQISNLKYNRDQKTVFVTVCFCLHLGDIVRSRPRSAGKETREGPSLVRAFSRGSPLLATRNGEISRRANCYMVKYCNTYTKFPSLKKAWIGSACKSKLPIKQYRLDQRRKRVKIVLEDCLAKEIVACVAGAWEIWGARVMHTREKYTHAFSYLAVTEHRSSHFPT